MNLLRLYCPLLEMPSQCHWVLLGNGKGSAGKGPLSALPRRASRVQLVIPAAEVVITQAALPAAARRGTGSVLAYAIEEKTVSEPDANHVVWLGSSADKGVLAVLDRAGLERWRLALGKVGIRAFEIHSEMMLLPWTAGEWSVFWNGSEGFARTGTLEAAATDAGDHETPPLSLKMMIERARESGNLPGSISLFTATDEALPDLAAWQAGLGVPIRHAGRWDWRDAGVDGGTGLAQESASWGSSIRGIASRLRLAIWVAGAALLLHAIALAIDWTLLANEQHTLRRQMESRFRATFPDTVAVVDPLLQMRRKLAEARHAAGQPDSGDFVPLIEKLAVELKTLPAGAVRIVSYESGRITVEISAIGESAINSIVIRLRELGLTVDATNSAGRATITVRSS